LLPASFLAVAMTAIIGAGEREEKEAGNNTAFNNDG
jgi:hypothetical protein